MKIKTDPTIRSLHGKFPKSNLIMQGPNNKNFTLAKSYAKPKTQSVVNHQAVFKSESVSIYNTVKNSHELFKNDLAIYTFAFNRTHVQDDKLPLVAHSIFTMLCYLSQKVNSFDLSTLTVNNFDDLVNTSPTIMHCINLGFIPHIPKSYFSGYDLMHSIVDGSVIFPSIPDQNFNSSVVSILESSSIQGEFFNTDVVSILAFLGTIIETANTCPKSTFLVLNTILELSDTCTKSTFIVLSTVVEDINNPAKSTYLVLVTQTNEIDHSCKTEYKVVAN